MSDDLSLAAAFLIGLLGSSHCIGMCGGITGALTMGLPDTTRARFLRLLPWLLAYNSGRLFSYAAAGLIVGFASQSAGELFQLNYPVGGVIGGLFMLALGLYIGGWYPALIRLEQLGGKLWRRLEPFGRKLMPVRSLPQALALGALWGWLPCGLVYSTLAWSAATASATHSAMLMLAFGLGTLPVLLAMGGAAQTLGRFARQPRVRMLAGALLIAFGVFMLLQAGSGGHVHHRH